MSKKREMPTKILFLVIVLLSALMSYMSFSLFKQNDGNSHASVSANIEFSDYLNDNNGLQTEQVSNSNQISTFERTDINIEDQSSTLSIQTQHYHVEIYYSLDFQGDQTIWTNDSKHSIPGSAVSIALFEKGGDPYFAGSYYFPESHSYESYGLDIPTGKYLQIFAHSPAPDNYFYGFFTGNFKPNGSASGSISSTPKTISGYDGYSSGTLQSNKDYFSPKTFYALYYKYKEPQPPPPVENNFVIQLGMGIKSVDVIITWPITASRSYNQYLTIDETYQITIPFGGIKITLTENPKVLQGYTFDKWTRIGNPCIYLTDHPTYGNQTYKRTIEIESTGDYGTILASALPTGKTSSEIRRTVIDFGSEIHYYLGGGVSFDPAVSMDKTYDCVFSSPHYC